MKSFSKKTPQIVDTDPILRIRLAFSIIGKHLGHKSDPPSPHSNSPSSTSTPPFSFHVSPFLCPLVSAPFF